MEFDLYEVGGCVRDAVLGLKTKDIDFVAVDQFLGERSAAQAFSDLQDQLTDEGFTIFLVDEDHFTIRAQFPKDHRHAKLWDGKAMTADVVLARAEGPYSDGRHPDWVEAAKLEDDLRRRDFTGNALARDEMGGIIDLFGGMKDLDTLTLRCVGSAEDRMREDSLRALRAIRFRITKGFHWDPELAEVMVNNDWLPDLLSSVSTERKREELEKCFRVTTIGTLDIFAFDVSREFMWACFGDTGPNSLWLQPSMKGR